MNKPPALSDDADEFYKECCELLDQVKSANGLPYLPFAMDIARLVKTYGGKLK